MNIQGVQKLTLLDFPGQVACIVFTGGCNLRCPFCHNAGLVRTPLAEENQTATVLEYLSGRRGMLDGVCITGGEPLLQPDLLDFMQKVRDMGYRIKLDTNGLLPRRLAAVLESGLVDYVAMDVKSSPEGYAAAAGSEVDIAAIDESICLLRGSGVDHEFRTTAVKGIHTVADFEAIGRWLAGPQVKYFIQGFVDSGNLLGSDCAAFSQEEMAALLAAVRPFIPGAALRG